MTKTKTKIILDPGSCHNGKMSYAKELIWLAANAGADAVKWQLFPKYKFLSTGEKKDCRPNIALPYEWFPELVNYGKSLKIEIFASSFDLESMVLIGTHCKSIKFAFSHNNVTDLRYLMNNTFNNPFDTVYISGDTNTIFPLNNKVKKLFCIPSYPVPYMINFEGLFPKFDGFSDHTMGIEQTKTAVLMGAKIIEKHFSLDKNNICCPDNNFALRPKQVENLIKEIRKIDSKCEF